MRVITEERLKEILVTIPDDISGRKYLVLLLEQLIEEECQEIDTLTVSKLRPMSELPKNAESVMAAYEDERGDIYFDITSSQCIEDEYSFSSEEYIGWIPLPIYKPE